MKEKMPRGAWSGFAGKKILAPLAFVLLAAGCGSAQPAAAPNPSQSPQPMTATPVPTPTPTPTTGVVKTFNITAANFSFTPSTLTVNKGDTVKIVLNNTGSWPHNFTLEAFNVQTKTIQTGQSDTVQFVADKTGSFQFYCSVDSHKDKGMVGTLTVK